MYVPGSDANTYVLATDRSLYWTLHPDGSGAYALCNRDGLRVHERVDAALADLDSGSTPRGATSLPDAVDGCDPCVESRRSGTFPMDAWHQLATQEAEPFLTCLLASMGNWTSARWRTGRRRPRRIEERVQSGYDCVCLRHRRLGSTSLRRQG